MHRPAPPKPRAKACPINIDHRPALAVTSTLSIRPSSDNSHFDPRRRTSIVRRRLRSRRRTSSAQALETRLALPARAGRSEGTGPTVPLLSAAPVLAASAKATADRPATPASTSAMHAAIAATSSRDGSMAEKPSSPRCCKSSSRNSVWNSAAHERRLTQHPVEERQAGPDAAHLVFHQRTTHPGDGLRPVFSPGDQLGDQRVVEHRHVGAGLSPAVVSDAGAGRAYEAQ